MPERPSSFCFCRKFAFAGEYNVIMYTGEKGVVEKKGTEG